MKKLLLYLLFIFLGLNVKAQDIYSINGVVSDQKGQPVPGATVFITNSKFVTATDNAGKFSLNNMWTGTYQVVVKMLGFDPAIQNVTVRKGTVTIKAMLHESTTTLKTVNITAKKNIPEIDRDEYLRLFKQTFIGQTDNAEKCELLNPEVLHFELVEGIQVLKANADDFLVIQNNTLGYRLKYLLTKFELDFNHHTSTYIGFPYFEEMEGTSEQHQEWKENRRQAYLSSDRHFFRSLMKNTLKEEGFLVYAVTNEVKHNDNLKPISGGVHLHDNPKKKFSAIPMSAIDSVFITGDDNFKTMLFTPAEVGTSLTGIDTITVKYLYIVYTGKEESPKFSKTGNPIELFPLVELPQKKKYIRQISLILPLAATVTADRNGWLNPAMGFRYSGYWGWQRIADFTPLDYFADIVADKKQ